MFVPVVLKLSGTTNSVPTQPPVKWAPGLSRG